MKDKLLQLMQQKGLTQGDIAKFAGVSRGLVNQYLGGKYRGDVAAFEEKLKGLFTSREEVFKSLDFKMCDFIAKDAIENHEIAIFVGEAGAGKSTYAAYLHAELVTSIKIDATLYTNARDLLNRLCAHLGIHARASLSRKLELVAEELKVAPVAIIIDEAEHLPVRALEVLRRIHDFSACPILLFGTNILLKNLMGKDGELRQLYSRISSKYLFKGLSKQESDAFFACDLFKYTKGNFRSSAKLYAKASRLSQLHSTPINEEILANAASMIILS